MSTIQAGISARIPAHGRYISLALRPGADAAVRPVLQALASAADGLHTVVGLGATLVARLDAAVPGLRSFSAPPASRVDLPATPAELWLWLRSEDDPGALLQRGRALARLLAPAFDVTHELAAFRHLDGRDLTGYADGTENPTGRDMVDTLGVQGQGPGLDGGSFVAVQQWEHALDRFDRFDRTTQDRMIGRRRNDNVELDDAPPSAHVRRTAQEDFSPEAFVVRRSMPWAEGARCGLLFTAFATGFDAFEAQLARMAGVEDGVVDDLFRFSKPVSGAYYWCPPAQAGHLDLRRLG
jgi:putative iron-dependent peroxidase